VQQRHAEDRHDRVADELLDRPAMATEDSGGRLEVVTENPAQRFGIELVAEGGRVDQVAEEHCHELAALAR